MEKEKRECVCCGKYAMYRDCVCSKCRRNDKVTLTKTNIKKQFRLTNNDLLGKNFFVFFSDINGNYGSAKYLVKEIKAYVKQLLKNDPKYVKKIVKKQELDDHKKILQQRKSDVDVIVSSLVNEHLLEVSNAVVKFIDSDMTLDQIKAELVKLDIYLDKRALFVKNLCEIVLEKLNDLSYLMKLLDKDEKYVTVLQRKGGYIYFVKHIGNYVSYFVNSIEYDSLIVDKVDILRSSYMDKIEEYMAGELFVIYDGY